MYLTGNSDHQKGGTGGAKESEYGKGPDGFYE